MSPLVISVLPADSAEGKQRAKTDPRLLAPVIAATKAGDVIQAAKLLIEAVFQLPPGGFDRYPQDRQTRVLENARTMPLIFAAPPPPAITCDMLKNFPQRRWSCAEKTRVVYALISEAISKCVPGAQLVVLQNVDHDGPIRDPAAFTAAIFELLIETVSEAGGTWLCS